MNLILRKELPKDYPVVFDIVKSAFLNEAYSDKTEHFLVERLRNSEAFVPDLSIVAELDDKLVGHILLTEINIVNKDTSSTSLAMAPVSVHPDFQGRGIGAKLILKSHEVAKELGYLSIILLGHDQYYPRFGYERADKFNISFPFEAPPQNCMALELVEGGLKNAGGLVHYAPEFNLNNSNS